MEQMFCQCGCGGRTSIARKTSTRQGHVKGEPHRFLRGHNNTQDLAARFASKVVTGPECWEWQGNRLPNGYGTIGIAHRTKYAHRVAWELANGPIPTGLEICHCCDNRRCVRPDHLFLGTRRDNMQDAKAKGRLRSNAPKGLDAYQTKVTPAMAVDIHTLYDRGLTKAEIARRFDISHRTVRHVLDGTHWTARAA